MRAEFFYGGAMPKQQRPEKTTSLSKACRECGSEIPQSARVCHVCKAGQSGWRRLITSVTLFLGLITAFSSGCAFVASKYPEVRNEFFPEKLNVKVISASAWGEITVVNNNRYPIVVKSMEFQSEIRYDEIDERSDSRGLVFKQKGINQTVSPNSSLSHYLPGTRMAGQHATKDELFQALWRSSAQKYKGLQSRVADLESLVEKKGCVTYQMLTKSSTEYAGYQEQLRQLDLIVADPKKQPPAKWHERIVEFPASLKIRVLPVHPRKKAIETIDVPDVTLVMYKRNTEECNVWFATVKPSAS
jgi:hypothetical protein